MYVCLFSVIVAISQTNVITGQGEDRSPLDLEARLVALEHALSTLKTELYAKVASLKCDCSRNSSGLGTINGQQTGKRLLVPASPNKEKPAFYTFLSSDVLATIKHHTIAFDVVKTNVGNGYHQHSGTFIAPSAGTYVFDWMIQSTWTGVVYTQLMRNSEVLGEVVADSTHEYEFHSATGVVVTQLIEGDEVFIRTHPTDTSTGHIISRPGYRSSFSGWRV